MRVVVLEDYLNYAATSVCIEPLKRLGEVVCYTEEGYGWKFIPAVENIIAFIEGRPQRLAGDKEIDRQRQRQATYLT